MLCDHLWATIVPGNQWLTCVGRLAFPIFAFMIVEGYYHTHDLRKYVIRLLIGAVLSEIPFNLMYGGSIFYPYHQNVLWTFLLSLGCIVLIEKSKKRGRLWLAIPVAVVVTILGTALGFVTMVDYFGFGVLIVLVFYFSADTNGIIMCCSFSAYFISMRCCPVDGPSMILRRSIRQRPWRS